MLLGTVVLPSAPLLVPGVSAVVPDGVAAVGRAAAAALSGMPPAEVAVLVAGGPQALLHDRAEASMAGVGRPDLARTHPVDSAVLDRLSAAAQYPLARGGALPLGLAVLALLAGRRTRLVPVSVPAGAAFEALSAVGAGIAKAAADTGADTILVVAGDLSAGLDERSPLHVVDGAAAFDAAVLDAVDGASLERIAALGPREAARVGALGWAPLAVLHGAAAAAGIRLRRRLYAAPRGVGYLVADGVREQSRAG